MQNVIKSMVQESIEAKKLIYEKLSPEIEKAAELMVNAFRNNKKILKALRNEQCPRNNSSQRSHPV